MSTDDYEFVFFEKSKEIDEIIIDDSEEFNQVKNFVERFYPEKPNLQL